jgi:hypothetical protein
MSYFTCPACNQTIRRRSDGPAVTGYLFLVGSVVCGCGKREYYGTDIHALWREMGAA